MTEAAFRTLYAQYRDPLFRFGYRLTGSAEVAEDLVHDCFVSLYRNGFDESRASLKTYLYAAMRNLCSKHSRDTGREAESADMPDSAAAGSPLSDLISRETATAVQRAVAALPLVQREALILFEYEDLSLEEISQVLDAEVGAIKSRLHRAREALRKSLAMKEAAR
jgi:RNA polymerase sigma-70 factor (ECF subfamily)